MTYSQPRPDWVMCGGHMPNGKVRLIASKDLNRAEMEALFDGHPSYLQEPFRPTLPRYRLTADLRTYLIIEADDYPTAFKHLFGQWSPEPERRKIDGPPEETTHG